MSIMLKEFLPKFKKKLSSFILDESGNISKQSIVNVGTILATGVVASASVSATHMCGGGGGGDGGSGGGGGDGCCGDGDGGCCGI